MDLEQQKGIYWHQGGDHGAGSSLMRQTMWTGASLSLEGPEGGGGGGAVTLRNITG